MSTLFDTLPDLFPLRPRQQSAIDGIRQAIREGHKRIILQAPTGAGKTILASHIIAGALEKDRRPMFTVPQLSLIEQTIRRFEVQGIVDIGVIQGNNARTDGNARVQIASIQTLVRRPMPEVDFVLIDEIHLQFSALNKILDSEGWKEKIVIGLSATPWSKGMGLRWTKLVPFGTTKELIEEGWLTPLVAYGVPDEYAPDVSTVRTNFDGDYVESEAEKAMSTQQIVGNVVKTWIDKGPGEKTFMFCVNRSHARKMQQEFEASGIACGYIDGSMDASERERVFKKYRSGEYKIISSVGCLVVGVDEDVRCIIFLVLTKSEIKWVQAGGRGLRLAEGKDHLLLLDHAGTCEELGLFTDIHHDTLSMRDPNEKGDSFSDKKPSKPNRCPSCNVMVPRSRTVCPVCGTVLREPTKTPRNVNGELVPVESGKLARPKVSDEQAFYSGLIDFAQRRGFKIGWAKHKYHERFGRWPDRLSERPMTPRVAVKEFIRESAKRYREQQKQVKA